MRWGILGYGDIAPVFIESILSIEGQVVKAIGTRSGKERAQDAHPKADVLEYDAVISHPEVDIIYIATPHVSHAELSIKALKAGKHVICEKPAGLNQEEVTSIIEVAQQTGKLWQEGMWTRFMPAYKHMKSLLLELGSVKRVMVDFSFKTEQGSERRLLNKALAGGALYDVGVYPLAFVLDVLGEPETFNTMAEFTETGVDAQCLWQFGYQNGSLAQMSSAITLEGHKSAWIYGENGWLHMPLFWHGREVHGEINGQEFLEHWPYKSTGYVHMIEAVLTAIEQHDIETREFTHEDSLTSARWIDRILDQIGYHGD